jgi:xylulokinase
MTLNTSAGDVYRAFQEALAYGVRHNIEALRGEGVEAKRILAIGGMSKSRQLIQIISDVSGCPQLVPREKIGASYGDAFLAALGAGYLPDVSSISEWVSYEYEVQPRQEYVECYEKGFRRFRELYMSLEPFM